jgi:hypothetical protein
MNSTRVRKILLVLVVLLAALGCRFTAGQAPGEEQAPGNQEQPTATEAPTEPPIFPDQEMTVGEPGGAELSIQPGALSEDAEVSVEDTGAGVPFASGSPLSSASDEYVVDLGGAQQVGEITMTVPLEGTSKQSQVDGSRVYMVWTEPESGYPSVVGAKVVGDQLTFPVVGSGKYQVYWLLSHEALQNLVTVLDPLAVPTYQQRTPAWCSPTAMTNVVNYHQGAWQVPGFGAVWGESSNYFLAGKAGQPFDSGYFFHWLLGAGGYTVPSDVKQSFSNGNAEVIIWNWNAAITGAFNWSTLTYEQYINLDFADNLFDAFQAYVESFVWGNVGPRRPVAWGSSIAGHSRTITGSNGVEFYYNDPSSGSLNEDKAWDAYRQEVIDSFSGPKVEVIDTVIFYAEPRPANARRGVLWLFPGNNDDFPGSVALVDGDNGAFATNWVWDGQNGHSNGYYYEDLRGVLPPDALLGSQFKALDYGDEVEYVFGVRSISTQAYDFHVDVILQNENLSVLENVGMFDVTVPAGGRVDFNPAERFDLYGLPPSLYTLKFVLLQNGVYQDVKYVQFRVAETDLQPIVPQVILIKNAFCRLGPDPVFDDLTAFEAGTELTLLGYNPDRTWGKFERVVNDIPVRCWIGLGSVEIQGGENAPILPVPALPTEVPAGPVCTANLGKEDCEAAGGTYFVGAASASCICPE